MRKTENGWLFSGRCLRVRVDKNKIDPAYLSYFFGLEKFKNYIRSIAVGATMPSINTKILSDVPIYYPELDEQKLIANILYSLDEKIQLNRQINQNLEQIAQAIFKSWFVDFEPVKAKIEAKQNGRDPERAAMCAISGKTNEELDHLPADQLEQLAATAALFPDELVDSELGLIPKGWEYLSIYKFSDVIYGAPFSSKKFNQDKIGRPLIRIRDLKTFSPQFWTKEEHPKGTKIYSGDLLVGMDAEFTPTFWQGTESWLNQRVCQFKEQKNISKAFLYFSLRSHMKFFEKSKVGTTVIHLGKKDIDTIKLLMPSRELMLKIKEILDILIEQIISNTVQASTLASIRDTLLPKLLSGEISVTDTQAKIKETV